MNVGARDTVNIDESVHEIYKQLTEGSDPVTSPFKTMKDVFLWAACLGYLEGERKPINAKKMTIFRWAQFNLQIDIPIIKALALSGCSNIGFALNQDQMLDSVEEYANYGITKMKYLTLDLYGKGLFGLVEHITLKNS